MGGSVMGEFSREYFEGMAKAGQTSVDAEETKYWSIYDIERLGQAAAHQGNLALLDFSSQLAFDMLEEYTRLYPGDMDNIRALARMQREFDEILDTPQPLPQAFNV